jgi:hypothetical protein
VVKVRALLSSLIIATGVFTAVRAAAQQLSNPSTPTPQLQMSPAEQEIYQKAKTLVDWTPEKIHSIPFLHNVRLADNQEELPIILAQAAKTNVALFHDFPKIYCDEEIHSAGATQIPGRPHVFFQRQVSDHEFRYIIIPTPVGEYMAFEEYRTDKRGNRVDLATLPGMSLITSNFASSCLYLGAAEQRGSHFRYFGTQTIERRKCFLVGFAQDPQNARSVAVFHLTSGPVILLTQGLAWIDSQSFEVRKIETWLLAPRNDIGLESEDTVVDYFPIKPKEFDHTLWVPRDVTVSIIYKGTLVQNTHHYSKFKVFRVESTIRPVK